MPSPSIRGHALAARRAIAEEVRRAPGSKLDVDLSIAIGLPAGSLAQGPSAVRIHVERPRAQASVRRHPRMSD
jgi:hypothetical protein